MTSTLKWTEASALIQNASSIIIVTHISPDGDALGSMLGMANLLREMGKDVTTAVDGGTPEFLAFLPTSESILSEVTEGDFDVFLSVDSSDEERTGKCGEYARLHSKKVINLDHHPTNTMFGDVFLVNPIAVSATEIVFDWIEFMQGHLTQEIAFPLLTGLVTDTRGFRTSNVNPRTMEIAQHLMSAGASLTEITARTLDTMSYQSFHIWKHAVGRAKLTDGVMHASVLHSDYARIGQQQANTSGLSSFLVQINDAMISVVFKETEEGQIELSMRCKPGFDVSQVAFALGGGGHKQAAGATIDGPLEDAKKRVLPLLREAVKLGTLTIV